MLDDYDLERIYNASDKLITIAWMRNWFDRWATRPWIGRFSIHLCSSEKARDYFQGKTDQKSAVFRLATNPDRFNPSVEAVESYSSDYCFTGNFWGSSREIESFNPGKLPYQFALYGSGWEQHEQFKPYYRGKLPYPEMSRVYASSKILIDDANSATKQWGSVNSRVFDALASERMVLSNCEIGSQEVFSGELPTYKTVEELESQIELLLKQDSLRIPLVKRLSRMVLEKHTYSVRAIELRSIIAKRLEVNVTEKCDASNFSHLNP
jgi:spore maturation protein CgeB